MLTASQAKESVRVFRERLAERVYKEIDKKYPNVLEDINNIIRKQAVAGYSNANIQVSKYLGTYYIGTIKYFLSLLGYEASYHGATEELIVTWK